MQPYEELLALFKEYRLLDSIGSVLGWDERTYMPPKGSPHRADQMALIAKLAHEKITAPRIGDLIGTLTGSDLVKNSVSDQAVNLREIRRTRDRAVKMPASLVEELARTTTRAQNVWQEARKNNDFQSFAPWLDKIVRLKQQEAKAVGYSAAPYDALLDEYEPGATTAEITQVFRELRQDLVPLVERITSCGRKPKKDILHREYPVDRQFLFGQGAAAAIGFDFMAGRLDTTVHPFCSGIGPGDCRLTTRYNPRHFNEAFFGILHEAGHGIYEQGLDPRHFGSPLGSACSLGIHESQSRLWENQVGRGVAFWQHFFPRLRQTFPGTVDDVSLDEFVWAVNDVERSFIRVEADEATYNLHIILRFELEQALVNGELPPADVPAAWNEKFQQMFGLTPPSHAQGCLQDIHWSMGGLGYFPTYALGNLYAAQFMDRARQDLSGLDGMFRQGDFAPLKNWLNSNIHQPGQRYVPRELCQRVTGKPLSHKPLLDYLWKKYGALYQLS
jgi:carboxypeptidase Taq